jgi:hypothetical protein
MMRVLVTIIAVAVGAGTSQEAARTADLVKKLDAEDWVEQAQAAKELVKLGPPVLEALRPAAMSDSPSAKYWASMISEAVLRKVPSPSEPLPVNPEPIAGTPNPKGFAPGPNDMGALVFICNNPGHGPYEATFSRCISCAKTKRFAYDYGADCYRCAVCKRAYTRKEIVCDKCGQSPAGRIPIRMKTAGGL